MSLERSKISIKEILKILELNFDVKGSIKELVGEVDYNFKVESKSTQTSDNVVATNEVLKI